MSRFGQFKRRSSGWLRREIARPVSPRTGPTRSTSSQNWQVPTWAAGEDLESARREDPAPGPIIYGVNVVLPEIRGVQEPVQRVLELPEIWRRQEQVPAFRDELRVTADHPRQSLKCSMNPNE